MEEKEKNAKPADGIITSEGSPVYPQQQQPCRQFFASMIGGRFIRQACEKWVKKFIKSWRFDKREHKKPSGVTNKERLSSHMTRGL